jgi:hypothetical protein
MTSRAALRTWSVAAFTLWVTAGLAASSTDQVRKAGGVLDVRVLNPLGAPVQDVWVRAWPAEGTAPKGPDEVSDKGLTDSKGRIRLAVPETGSYKVEARIWIKTATASTTVHVLPGPDATPVELRLATGFEVSGRVVGENGAGVPGADVTLTDGADLGLWATTKPDGSLTGRVLVDGTRLSGGSVSAQSEEGYERFVRTAHDGTFTLDRLAAGPVTLRVTDNQVFAGLQTVQLTKNQKVSISLATGSLAGRVLTATGGPVGGAWVNLDAWPPARNKPEGALGDAFTLTRTDGTFQIPRIGAGTYRIRISQGGFAPVETTAEVPPGGSSAPVAVALKPQ